MVYDAARDVVVLFGGLTHENDALGDTWEWNGDDWRLMSTQGPSAGSDFALVYDPVRERSVLFGGIARAHVNTVFEDMWEWDGVAWSRIPESGDWPAARDRHAMAFDSWRNVIVMTGGIRRRSTTRPESGMDRLGRFKVRGVAISRVTGRRLMSIAVALCSGEWCATCTSGNGMETDGTSWRRGWQRIAILNCCSIAFGMSRCFLTADRRATNVGSGTAHPGRPLRKTTPRRA